MLRPIEISLEYFVCHRDYFQKNVIIIFLSCSQYQSKEETPVDAHLNYYVILIISFKDKKKILKKHKNKPAEINIPNRKLPHLYINIFNKKLQTIKNISN